MTALFFISGERSSGGMDASLMARNEKLEDENGATLKEWYAEKLGGG